MYMYELFPSHKHTHTHTTHSVQICWHDLAFFDPALYEGLRKLVLAAQREDQHVSEMGIALSSLSSSSLASLYLSSLSPSPLSLSLSLFLSLSLIL